MAISDNEVLREGQRTVSGVFEFPEYGTELPFSITIGDNCCDGHAESAANQMVRLYAKELEHEDRCAVKVRYITKCMNVEE